MKIASFLPDDELAANANNMYNRLSASRNDLIQLNTTLDEITSEIRESEALHGNALFNNTNHTNAFNDIPEETIGYLEHYAFKNGEIMYDTIMSDLIHQAIKKINRVRKFYKGRFKAIDESNRARFNSLELQVQELTSALHKADAERLLYLRAANEVRSLTGAHHGAQPTVAAASVQEASTASEGEPPAEGESKYTVLVDAVMGKHDADKDSEAFAQSSKHAQMAKSLANILQKERKVRHHGEAIVNLLS